MKYDLIAEAYVNMYSPKEQYLSEEMLMEDRLDYLKDTMGHFDTSHDPYAIHHDTNSIIDHFAEHGDPSRNKVHTQYLLNLYKRGAIRQADAPRANQVLSNFDRYKSLLQPSERNLSTKAYPSIQHIEDKIAPHIGSAVTNKEKAAKAKDMLDRASHRKIFDNTEEGGNLRVYRLSSDDAGVESAKILYGRKGLVKPTNCCHTWGTPKTMNLGYSDNRENRLLNYTKEDHPETNIYMLHDVGPDGKVRNVFSWHAASNQLMNEENTEPTVEHFNRVFPNNQFSDAVHKNHEMITHGPKLDLDNL